MRPITRILTTKVLSRSSQREQIQALGREFGRHTCGTKDPVGNGGYFVGDHQPPTAINPERNPQVYRIARTVACRRWLGQSPQMAKSLKEGAMKWIMSAGGPLICLEQHLEPSWGGIDKLTIPCSGARTDYDRACEPYRTRPPYDYLNIVPVHGGEALLFGDVALDTALCKARSGALMVVRLIYACADFDDMFDSFMSKLDESIFDSPIEAIDFTIETSALSMFDSAEPGYNESKDRLLFELYPGDYRGVDQCIQPRSRRLLDRAQVRPAWPAYLTNRHYKNSYSIVAALDKQ